MKKQHVELSLKRVVTDGFWKSPPDLLASIRQHGLLYPILVTEDLEQPGRYRVRDGRRRLACMHALGKSTIPF